jgi:hypothetical protein
MLSDQVYAVAFALTVATLIVSFAISTSTHTRRQQHMQPVIHGSAPWR